MRGLKPPGAGEKRVRGSREESGLAMTLGISLAFEAWGGGREPGSPPAPRPTSAGMSVAYVSIL